MWGISKKIKNADFWREFILMSLMLGIAKSDASTSMLREVASKQNIILWVELEALAKR